MQYFYKVLTQYFYKVTGRLTQDHSHPSLSHFPSLLPDPQNSRSPFAFLPFYPTKNTAISTYITHSIYVQLNFIEYWDHFHGVLTESYFCPKLYLTK